MDSIYNQWSQELQNLTRKTLNEPNYLKNPNMDTKLKKIIKKESGQILEMSFGVIKFANNLETNWVVSLRDGGTETFESLNELISAGWVLD
jgi:hypothetical protein